MSNKDDERFMVIVKYLKANDFITKSEAAKILAVEDKTAQRILAKAVEMKLLFSEGQRKSTIYKLKP